MEYIWIIVAFAAGFLGTFVWFSQHMKAEKFRWEAEKENSLKALQNEIFSRESQITILESKEVEFREELKELNVKIDEIQKQKSKADVEVAQLQTQMKNLEQQIEEAEPLKQALEKERKTRIDFEKENASLKASLESLKEMLNEEKKRLEEVKEQMKQEFALIANKVLKENSEAFGQHSKKNIGELINPLKERIERFEKRVEDTYEKGRKDQLELHDEFKKIYNLSVQLDKDAKNLTKALKSDSKQQGNWGEVVLERILEESGLIKGQEYLIQETGENEDGRVIRPDVIIQLPQDKFLIVDSKVSLTAYQEYVSLEDKDARESALKRHMDSVKKHVKELSEKNYATIKGKNTPDFVLMFMPIEPAFAAAIQADHSLFNYAWERRVVIVSPTTLLATLRTIESIWRQEKQTRNALDIARQAGSLYDKFVGFTEDLDKIGTHLDKTQRSYQEARKKLSEGRGNLVGQVEKLKTMGAKAQKSIDVNLLEE